MFFAGCWRRFTGYVCKRKEGTATKELQYQYYKIKGKLFGDNGQNCLQNYFRAQGMTIGEGCRIYSNIVTTESYLISIGDRVTISGEVLLITHDNSICKCMDGATDLFGKIAIGSNCFIGARSLILYGVSLADSIIVAAGSVVTHSFHEKGIIIGGVPAVKIGETHLLAERMKDKSWNLNGMAREEKDRLLRENIKLVER